MNPTETETRRASLRRIAYTHYLRTGRVPHDHIMDAGIAREVDILRAAGVETFESCEGGPGHVFFEPTVRFHGDQAEGFRALSVAIREGLPTDQLRRVWPLADGEPTGPCWELTFKR